jgi:hypothetical protein
MSVGRGVVHLHYPARVQAHEPFGATEFSWTTGAA